MFCQNKSSGINVLRALELRSAENVIHLDALDRYRKTKVHFVDCLIAASAKAEDLPVATFDEDFRKFGDVRIENA